MRQVLKWTEKVVCRQGRNGPKGQLLQAPIHQNYSIFLAYWFILSEFAGNGGNMRSIKLSLTIAMITLLAATAVVFGQDDVFSHPDVDYTFVLPDAKWKMTGRPSATSPNVEYVYGDRRDGHFEVRKLTVAKDAILSEVIRDDEAKRQFLPGYVAGKEESFAGRLRGTVFNFEYVQAGKNMSGRHYFLRANDTTVYVVKFSGQKDTLQKIRNQTDSIARTFSLRS
jgi:hypothetical protein